jgi:hypothetical protein
VKNNLDKGVKADKWRDRGKINWFVRILTNLLTDFKTEVP